MRKENFHQPNVKPPSKIITRTDYWYGLSSASSHMLFVQKCVLNILANEQEHFAYHYGIEGLIPNWWMAL